MAKMSLKSGDHSVPGNVVGGRAARAAAAAVAPRAAEEDVALRVLRGDLVILAPASVASAASAALLMLLKLLLKRGCDHARRVGGPRADAEDAGRPEVLLRAGAPHQAVIALKRTNRDLGAIFK